MNTSEQAMQEEKLRKIDAEIAKLMAETAKINKETKWYEYVVITGSVLAIVAVAKFFL